MKYLASTLLGSLCLFLQSTVFLVPAVYAEQMTAASETDMGLLQHVIDPDPRAVKLQRYLAMHKSPLSPYATIFVLKADEYNLPDWKLVPAITGVESTFGKAIPLNSYNAYGWVNGAYSFANWEESIDIVSKTLKSKYYDRGATTVEEIGRIYAPPSQTWAHNVRFFMQKIEDFSAKTS